MKKILFILSMAALALTFALVSCEKEPDPNNPNDGNGGDANSTIAKGVIKSDRIYFHDSINHSFGFDDDWVFQSATAVISTTTSLTCDKGSLSFTGPYCWVFADFDRAVLINEGDEIGPRDFVLNGSNWEEDGYADLPILDMVDGQTFYVALRHCDEWRDIAYYGWAKGQFHRSYNSCSVTWQECYYETRRNTSIKAGARN